MCLRLILSGQQTLFIQLRLSLDSVLIEFITSLKLKSGRRPPTWIFINFLTAGRATMLIMLITIHTTIIPLNESQTFSNY